MSGPRLTRDVHGAGDVFEHDGGLDGVLRVRADREGTVVLHDHAARAVSAQGLDDAAADRVVADDREGPTGMGPPNSSAIAVMTQGISSPRAAQATP